MMRSVLVAATAVVAAALPNPVAPVLQSDSYWTKHPISHQGIDDQIAKINQMLNVLQSNKTVWENDPYKAEIWGSITDHRNQMEAYRQWGSLTRIKQFCETGMSAGKSALNLLASNPEAKLASFDMGDRYYSQPVSEYLQKAFPGRFEAHFGSSFGPTGTINQFVQAHPGFQCDLVLVDGDHNGEAAANDIIGFHPISNCDTVLLMDDVQNPRFPGPDHAYKSLKEKNFVHWYPCDYKDGAQAGGSTFCIGQFVKDKDGKDCPEWKLQSSSAASLQMLQ